MAEILPLDELMKKTIEKAAPSEPGASLPAPFVNQVHLNIGPSGVRILFGEKFGRSPEINARTAVMMPMDTARALAEMILRAADAVEVASTLKDAPEPETPPAASVEDLADVIRVGRQGP